MNPESLIAYCGFYGATCGQWRNNTVLKDLSKTLLELVDAMNFSFWLPKDAEEFNYIEFRKGLEYFSRTDTQLVCTKCCQGGDGNDECNIRRCCRNKGLGLCFDCANFENCEHYKGNVERLIEGQRYRRIGKKKWLQEWIEKADNGFEIHSGKYYRILVEKLHKPIGS